jgi:hypothetical protein
MVKKLGVLLSIGMLVALPGCCKDWGCKPKDKEGREDRKKDRKDKEMKHHKRKMEKIDKEYED